MLLGVDSSGKLVRWQNSFNYYACNLSVGLGSVSSPSHPLDVGGNAQISGTLTMGSLVSTGSATILGNLATTGSASVANGFLTLQSLATTTNSAATYSAGPDTRINTYSISTATTATNFLDLVANGTANTSVSGVIRFLTKSTATTSTPSERMRIDGGGNVGIGAANLTAPLVVGLSSGAYGTAHSNGGGVSLVLAGNVAFQNSGPEFTSADGRFVFWDNNLSAGHANWMVSAPDKAIKFSSAGGITTALIGNYDTTGSFGIYNMGAQRLHVSSVSGNIGIGTTSPTQKLDVAGNISASGYLTIGSGTFSGTLAAATVASTTLSATTGSYAGTVYATGVITSHAKVRVPESGDLSMGSFTNSNGLGTP